MASIDNCQQVDRLNSILRGAIGRNAIAAAGSYQYMDPVTGTLKTATVPEDEKTAAAVAYTAALTALKDYVATLNP